MKFATKPIRYYPPHLRHVATLPWEIKNSNVPQMWKKTQTNSILIASNFVIQSQILIFTVFKNSESFPILIASKTFHVTVLLLFYFCDQFVAPKIRHSRRHCSVCQQSTWYSATSHEDKILIKKVCIGRDTQQRG